MTKTAFENILIAPPGNFIEIIKLEADAERLLKVLFQNATHTSARNADNCFRAVNVHIKDEL